MHPIEQYRDDINIWYILWYVYFRHILYTDNQVNTIVVGRQNISNHGINSSPAGQNGRHFADDVFRCILVNEKFILIKISLNFVPKCPIDDKPAYVRGGGGGGFSGFRTRRLGSIVHLIFQTLVNENDHKETCFLRKDGVHQAFYHW